MQIGIQLLQPVRRGIGVRQDRDRLHQAERRPDDEQQRRRGLRDGPAVSDSLNSGRHEYDGAEQNVHVVCVDTICLKVSTWAPILMLAAVLDTSTASSNRSALRALLSLTSLKPSRKSASRSNNRRSCAAAFARSRGQAATLEWKIAPAATRITTLRTNAASDKYAT